MGEGSIATGAGTVNSAVCYRARMEQEPVVVYTAQGEFEETQVRTFLAAHDIPTMIRGEALRKTHSLTLDGIGEVEILVAPEHFSEARDLLAAAERGDLALDDDEGPI